MFEASVPDDPLDYAVTYRVLRDVVVIIEMLPDEARFKERTYPRLRRLRDFRSRWPDLAGTDWQTGDAAAFLQLEPQHTAQTEIRVALAVRLAALRKERRWTHDELATRLGTSRSRVSKMERADVSVSIDLLIRSLLKLGITRLQLALLIARGPESAPRPAGKEAGSVSDLTHAVYAQRDAYLSRAMAAGVHVAGSPAAAAECSAAAPPAATP